MESKTISSPAQRSRRDDTLHTEEGSRWKVSRMSTLHRWFESDSLLQSVGVHRRQRVYSEGAAMNCPKCGSEMRELPQTGLVENPTSPADTEITGWIFWCSECGYESKLEREKPDPKDDPLIRKLKEPCEDVQYDI